MCVNVCVYASFCQRDSIENTEMRQLIYKKMKTAPVDYTSLVSCSLEIVLFASSLPDKITIKQRSISCFPDIS